MVDSKQQKWWFFFFGSGMKPMRLSHRIQGFLYPTSLSYYVPTITDQEATERKFVKTLIKCYLMQNSKSILESNQNITPHSRKNSWWEFVTYISPALLKRNVHEPLSVFLNFHPGGENYIFQLNIMLILRIIICKNLLKWYIFMTLEMFSDF